jgi:hypothetical protein
MPSPVSPDYRRAPAAARVPPRSGARASVAPAFARNGAPGHRVITQSHDDGWSGTGYAAPPPATRHGQPPARELRRRQRQKARRRRRRIGLVAVLLLVAAGAGLVVLRGFGGARDLIELRASGSTPDTGAAAPGDATATPTLESEGGAPSAEPTGTPTYTGPVTGPGTFSYASGRSKVLGTAGTLHRFRVAVEKGTGQRADAFAASVVATLGDKRSWIGGRNVRLQQVPGDADYDFILYLATPGTSEKMCLSGGLHTEKFTSCRIPGKVIVNLARWLDSVPGYNAPLEVYQQYAINHEVGHELGHGHEACPGPGKTAPLMQQQTYGLKGCLANAWPYLDGKRYAGMPIP